jgi:undecaprenyl-diphosphatase
VVHLKLVAARGTVGEVMNAIAEKSPSRWTDWHRKFVVEERYVDPAVRQRFYVLSVTLIVIGAIAFSILLYGVLTHTGIQKLDVPVERWFDAQRSTPATGFMIALAIIFGPVALPIIVFVVVVVWIIAARHVWRPLVLTAGMIVGVITALTLAPVVKHPRPPIGLMLFGPDHTYSFPSGHVLGTADFVLILAFLLSSRIQRPAFTAGSVTVAILIIAIQVISRLYLGYHWFTDTMASIALAMIILGLIIAVDTARTVRIHGEPVHGELSQPQTDGT